MGNREWGGVAIVFISFLWWCFGERDGDEDNAVGKVVSGEVSRCISRVNMVIVFNI